MDYKDIKTADDASVFIAQWYMKITEQNIEPNAEETKQLKEVAEKFNLIKE